MNRQRGKWWNFGCGGKYYGKCWLWSLNWTYGNR